MASVAATTSTEDARQAQFGLLAGLACYLIWGFLPLLFYILKDVGSVTIVADRTVWSLILVGGILIVSRRLPEVAAALRDPATLRSMLISSLLLACNWLLYVWAVETGQVLEASFGYFANPLINVAIGMALLGERQNRWQMVSIAIALFAIGVQAIGIGRVPFVALGLAVSFGFYGFFRKTAKVSSVTGLFVETLMLAPVAAGYLIYTFIRDGGPGPHGDPYQMSLLLLTGPATSITLILFAFAAQRLRLTTIGMLQYIAPSIQFFLAIWVFGEALNGLRLLSFGLIWLSLLVYSADSLARRGSRAMG